MMFRMFVVVAVLWLVASVALATPSGEVGLDKWWDYTFGDGDPDNSSNLCWGQDPVTGWQPGLQHYADYTLYSGTTPIESKGSWVSGPNTQGNISLILLEAAGYEPVNELYWYPIGSRPNKALLFTGGNDPGDTAVFQTSGQNIGFFFRSPKGTPAGGGSGLGAYSNVPDQWYNRASESGVETPGADPSDPINDPDDRNIFTNDDQLLVAQVPLDGPYGGKWIVHAGGVPYFVQGGEWLLAWEDLDGCQSDLNKQRGVNVKVDGGRYPGGLDTGDGTGEPDYNDFFVAYAATTTAITTVPEPMSITLLALACVGGGVAFRRKRR